MDDLRGRRSRTRERPVSEVVPIQSLRYPLPLQRIDETSSVAHEQYLSGRRSGADDTQLQPSTE